MSKLTTLCMIASLLLFTLTCTAAARLEPAFSDVTPMKIPSTDEEAAERIDVNENCTGAGEEECLMRRMLAAHLDYIYTQKQKQP